MQLMHNLCNNPEAINGIKYGEGSLDRIQNWVQERLLWYYKS